MPMILTPPSILLLPQTTLTRILPVSTVFPFLTHILPLFGGRLLLVHLKLSTPFMPGAMGLQKSTWMIVITPVKCTTTTTGLTVTFKISTVILFPFLMTMTWRTNVMRNALSLEKCLDDL
jgi:hypothetical protein